MPVSKSVRDIEQGDPDEEAALLGVGNPPAQPSNNRNPEEFNLEPLGTGNVPAHLSNNGNSEESSFNLQLDLDHQLMNTKNPEELSLEPLGAGNLATQLSNTRNSEFSLNPQLGVDCQLSKNQNPEESDKWLGGDGSLPTSSTTNQNVHHSNNDLTGSTKSNISHQDDLERQKKLNKRLLDVMNKGKFDIKELQKVLDEGADVNASCHDHSGDVYACHIGNLFEEKTLAIVKKAKMLSLVSEDWTPLHIAAFRACDKSVECIELLIAAGGDPNIRDEQGRTALDVTGLAYSVGIMPMIEDSDYFTPVIKLLFEKGGQHYTMKEGGVNGVTTPLHTTVVFQNKDALHELLRNGASSACWNENGETPLDLCVESQLEDILKILVEYGPDVTSRDGNTFLRTAVEADWVSGVRIALEAGADVTLKADDGETPLHAAAMHILDTFTEENAKMFPEIELRKDVFLAILNVAKRNNVVDCLNKTGATALFYAFKNGSIFTASHLLGNGASGRHTTGNNLSVFHIAANNGSIRPLKYLLNFDDDTTTLMINSLNSKGLGPIHYAVLKNSIEGIQLLVRRGANLCLRTSSPYELTTPLHLAAANDHVEIAEYIIKQSQPLFGKLRDERNPILQFDSNGFLPLHSAISTGSENTAKILLKYNSNLVVQVGSESSGNAMDMIILHNKNPKEFLEDVLDARISFAGSPTKSNKVKIDYQLLMPELGLKKEMDVVEALINTGNEYEQKKLLLHPLIESYIYFKWRAARPYYFIIAAIYMIFVVSLAGYEISVFAHKDTSKTKLECSKLMAGGCIIIFLILIIISQELLMNVEGLRYFMKPENWINILTLSLTVILLPAIMVPAWEEADWPRHVATAALLLACVQLLNILSQYPSWGYYVVMFKKVAYNVIKILGTFSFLIFAFAVSFMIQFRSEVPFDGPWDAFIKTLFLMTAEFEYNSVFSQDNAKKFGYSFQIARIIFVVFLIFATIVLMNMMVGVAVDDINELKSHGNMGRLEKQAHFVRSLDRLDYNLTNRFFRCLPERYRRQQFPLRITLQGNVVELENDYNITELPKSFRDACFNIAQKNKEKEGEQAEKDTDQKADDRRKNFYFETYKNFKELRCKISDIASQIEDLNKKIDSLPFVCNDK